MRQDSGIGVLDKAVGVLHAVADSPCGLAELCERTGLPRATAHRLAAGLEVHRLLSRNGDGRWRLGPALTELAGQVNDPLLAAGAVVLPRRRDAASRAARGDVHRSCPCRSSQAWLGTKRRRAGVRCGERLGAGARWSRCSNRRRLGVRADRPDGTPAWCPLGRRPFGRSGRTHPSTLIFCRTGPTRELGNAKSTQFLDEMGAFASARAERLVAPMGFEPTLPP